LKKAAMEENESREDYKDGVYETVVRAGKRTYFFDVRSTRSKDHYLTITESKRRYREDGSHYYQKHKIFLYKEDFEKFTGALSDAIKKVIELNNQEGEELSESVENSFTDINFEDLENG
jgi:hypothetical protein